MICSIMLSNRHRKLDAGRGTMHIVNTMDGSHQDVNRLVALENIEQTLTNRQQADGGTGKKNRANERLVSQWRERACLEIADFGYQLVEHLPFGFDVSTQQAKPPQIVEGSFAQLFGGASK